MVSCSIFGCKNRSERKQEGITFHAFPTDSVAKKKWIAATGRMNWTPSKFARVCSIHFESSLFTRKLNRTELFRDAIPSLNVDETPPTYSWVAENNSTAVTPKRLRRRQIHETAASSSSVAENNLTADTPKRLRRRQIHETDLHETPVSSSSVAENNSTAVTPKRLRRRQIHETPNSKRLLQSDEEKLGTPRRLTKKLKRQQILSERRLKKLRAVSQKTRRLEKKVANLEHIIEELKVNNLVSEENSELLKSVDPNNTDFIKKILNVRGPRNFSPSLRKFALCLHFISPRAYKYVRQHFKTCLPHPKTIYTWYKCINGSPGFTTESLKCLELLAKTTPKTIYAALTLDEMAIRKHIEWDGKKSVGFVDFGENFDGDDATVAREALVFMLTAINGSFKIPVGYFLVNGCTGEQKAALVTNCIKLVTSCGIQILSLTFDGCPSNLAMAKHLGCNLHPDNLNTVFQIDGQKVVVFPDPAHMLKLIRNTLGQKKELIDGKGNKISWHYVESLYTLQDNEGLHMANKIKKDHICFSRQIMKVKLAAQTFSNSVAEAINYCDKKMSILDFAGSDGTTEFIKKINDLFDIMNSRNLSNYGFKKPIKINNFSEINAFLNSMKEYITNIKIKEQPILRSARKMGFLGFLICICSVQSLYENVISKNLLLFLPTYKLSRVFF